MAQDIRALAIPVFTVDEDGVTHRRSRDSEVRIGGEHGLGRHNAERAGQPDAVKHPDQVRAHRSAEGGSALGPADHLVVVEPPRQRLSCRGDGETQLRLSWRDSHEYDARVWGWQRIERSIAELKVVGRSAMQAQFRSGDGRVRRRHLPESGTHAICDAALGPYSTSEKELADPLIDRLGEGMLCLADRGFYSFERFQRARGTGAQLLWRVMGHMLLPREEQLADGSYVTRVYKTQNDQRRKRAGERVRVVEYELADPALSPMTNATGC